MTFFNFKADHIKYRPSMSMIRRILQPDQGIRGTQRLKARQKKQNTSRGYAELWLPESLAPQSLTRLSLSQSCGSQRSKLSCKKSACCDHRHQNLTDTCQNRKKKGTVTFNQTSNWELFVNNNRTCVGLRSTIPFPLSSW